MSEERLKEIHDSIEFQMQLQQAVGYKSRYDDLLVEEIDLYNEVIELQQERNNYKELYEKEQEKTDKAFSWITLMLMDNDVSKEKALITIKNVLSNEMEGKTIL